MKTLISRVKPNVGMHLEVIGADGKCNLTELKVVFVIHSLEYQNTDICVFEDGSKACVIYWKRLCD
jgi:hypothetical protein